MNNKKKVLFFPFELLAHYLRCLVLADRYNKEEYEIYFPYSDAYNSYVEAHGYKTFVATGFDSSVVMDCAAKFDFSWLEYKDMERVLLGQIAAIQELQPALVIGDVAPTLKMAAEYTGVPYTALMNGYMSPFYARGRKISRSHPAHSFMECMPDTLATQFTAYGEQLAFWKIHKPFKQLRKKYKLQQLRSYLWENQGDDNLICDLPELFPQRNLPSNYRIIGPLIYAQQDPETNRILNQLDGSRPTICVCLGSTGNWEAMQFLNDPYYERFNIIAAGDTRRILTAANIISRPFVNLPEVLEHSDLMICHGGNGTVNCGILKGTFMLCLTSHFEQEWNVDALERHGYGRSADDFCTEDWKHAISAALTKLKAISA